MGQKVNPTGFRTGITEDWKSRWYAPKAAYGDFLVEDFKVRKLIDAKLNRKPPFAAVANAAEQETPTRNTLYVAKAWVDPGPVIKRFQPKDRGKAYPINKRTSHLVVTIDERGEGEVVRPNRKTVGGRQGKAFR